MQEEEQEAAEVRFRHYAVSSLPEQAAAEAAVAVAAQAAEEARAAESAAVQAAEEARAAKAATELAAEVARAAQEVAELARKALRKGVLGEYQQMLSTHDGLAQQRARIMDRFLSSKPLDVQRRELFERALNKHVEDQATRLLGATWARFGMSALAQRVATGLKREHHAVLDDFLDVLTAAGVRQLLREMHASGELLPGEVHGGLKQQQRSDLMCWLPVSPEQVVLRQLLGALEAVLGIRDC
jgi:hypothetical protein